MSQDPSPEAASDAADQGAADQGAAWPDIEIKDFRRVLGRFATGVAIVSALDPDDGAPFGMTINSVTSVSLTPPLILFCLDHRAHCHPVFHRVGGFVINILTEEQKALSVRFATPHIDRFAGIPWSKNATGAPILKGSLAAIECRIHNVHREGDHDIVIGRVVTLNYQETARPLLYYAGGYGRLVSFSE